METGAELCRECYEFFGPIAEAKGDPTARASEQAQSVFDQQIMTMMQSQYSNQTGTLNYLKSKMQPMIDAGGIGYSPRALAAMRTSSTDTLSNQFQGAERAINATEQRGLPSGVNAQVSGSLMAQEAEAQAAGQNQITEADANLKNQNYWNAIGALSGVASQNDPLGYANAATSGSGAVAGLSTAVTNANQSQLLGALGGVASGVGSIIGGKLAGGCWIAAKIFDGWLDPRTVIVRDYIFGGFAKTWYGNIVAKLYTEHGEWVSKQPILVWALRPLFFAALRAGKS